MIRKFFLTVVFLCFSIIIVRAQYFVKSSDLFKRDDAGSQTGRLNIIQDPAIDTLISRYILANLNLEEKYGYSGIEGFRIQIYNSSNRNAREESGKVRADFMSKFPDIISYMIFAEPGYYKVRVGNFRSRTEAIRLYLIISKKFPDADLVPDIINISDLNTK